MYFGYTGKILDVSLATTHVMEKKLDVGVARKFLGGLGLGSKVLYDEVGPNVDPLSPDNVIIIANGPLTATTAPTTGRTEIITKSPLTGSIGTGNFGSWWGARLKLAGFDAVIIRGESNRPVYLWITDGLSELRNAEHLWGKDSWDTTDTLKGELGEDISVLSIGQAGENLVRFACPVADYHHAPGRSDAGCVMGAKKLKAIAVRGTKGVVAIAEPEQFKEAVKEIIKRIATYPEQGERLKTGSNYLNKVAADLGLLPCRNFQTGILPADSEIWNFPKSVEDYTIVGPEYCYNCLMSRYYGCNVITNIKTGRYAGLKVGGVGFSYDGRRWGSNCEIRSFPAMWKCRELCQRYGMDFSNPVPFAMELFQRGIITEEDTDGLELKWGNELAVMQMLRKIAYREGLGDVLAEGSERAAKEIGKGASRYALTVKGKEVQGFDPRTGPYARNLGIIVGPRGDDLNTTHGVGETFPEWARRAGWSKEEYLGWFVDWIDMFEDVKKEIFGIPPRPDALDGRSIKGKAALTKWHGELTSVFNSLDLCLFAANGFAAVGPTHFAKLYSACTGWHITPWEIMKAGERIFNLMKAYVVRDGFTRKDDDWPARFYEEPLPEGPFKGVALSKDVVYRLLDDYYELMGWDKDSGLPRRKKLLELDLEEAADELGRIGKLPNTSR